MWKNVEELKKIISQLVFCYDKKDGQGFVNQSECICSKKDQRECKAFYERNAFHQLYSELDAKGLTRKEILETFDSSLKNKESHWFRNNVVK